MAPVKPYAMRSSVSDILRKSLCFRRSRMPGETRGWWRSSATIERNGEK